MHLLQKINKIEKMQKIEFCNELKGKKEEAFLKFVNFSDISFYITAGTAHVW